MLKKQWICFLNSSFLSRRLTYCKQHVCVNNATHEVIKDHLGLYPNFINEEEQKALMKDVEKAFRRTKYEYDHWDGAIVGFRETEKSLWSPRSEEIISRVRQTAFEADDNVMSATHILDLAADGYINPHTDSVKFCGSTIAGLSLLSTCIMRYKLNESTENDSPVIVDVLLPPMSLYVMRDTLRYEFTHEILSAGSSYWNGNLIPRARRVSILSRCS